MEYIMVVEIEKLSRQRSAGDIVGAASYLLVSLPFWDLLKPLDTKGFGWIDSVQLMGLLGMIWVALTLRRVDKLKEKSPEEAAALFDELFQSNRSRAIAFGFHSAMLSSVILIVLNLEIFDWLNFRLSANDTAQLIFTMGGISLLLSRAFLERRNG